MSPTFLSGAIPALVTPMSAPGRVDPAAAASLAEAAAGQGASAVLVAGTTGEGSLISSQDRVALTAAVRATGVPVIAGASGPTLAALHADVARLAEAGAQAVLVLVPAFLPLTPEELVDGHLAVAERAPVPTIVYHIPQFTGSWLTPEAVSSLAGRPGIGGLKDSSPAAELRAALVQAAGPSLAVVVGHAPTLSQALRAGAAGSITAMGNLRLRQILALHAAVAQDPDDAAAGQLQASLSACEAALAAVPGCMPAALKAAMQLAGTVPERYCAPPLRSVEGRHLDAVRTALLR